MRKRLDDCIAHELSKVKTAARSAIWPRWNPDHFVAADSFRYQYPELADELIIHDVYLNNFVVSPTIDLDDISMSSFSEALLISIQSSENVLRILQQVRPRARACVLRLLRLQTDCAVMNERGDLDLLD